jgi:hypothetical protein
MGLPHSVSNNFKKKFHEYQQGREKNIGDFSPGGAKNLLNDLL